MLKNLLRDWSADGAPERSQSYGRIIKELSTRYQAWQDPEHPPRVLVPGEPCRMLSSAGSGAAMAAASGSQMLLSAARALPGMVGPEHPPKVFQPGEALQGSVLESAGVEAPCRC